MFSGSARTASFPSSLDIDRALTTRRYDRERRVVCPTGILRADVAVHKEFGGFDVELFGDVFADFDQLAAALFALAGLRFMAMFDAWQVIRQRLAPSACTLRLLRSRQRQLLDFRFDRRRIGLPIFFKQA